MPGTLDKSHIKQVMLVDANGDPGGISVGSVAVTAVASATDPVRTEGASVPLSVDLTGKLRVTGTGGGGGGGDATAANQVTGNNSLASIDTKIGSVDTKLSSQATAANQTTANSSLSSIDTKLSSQATAANQTTANSSLSTIVTNTGATKTSVDTVAARIGANTSSSWDGSSASTDVIGAVRFVGERIDALASDVIGNTTPATVAQDTSRIRVGGTDLTPKFAVISASASGDTPIVAAVTGKKIRVLSYMVSKSDAVNMKFRSGTTDITGLLYNGAAPSFSPVGHFETAAGAALNINLSGAVAVGGHLVYVEV